MREWAQTPTRRIAVGLGATLALTVARDVLPILPALLPAVWIPLFVGEPGAIRLPPPSGTRPSFFTSRCSRSPGASCS